MDAKDVAGTDERIHPDPAEKKQRLRKQMAFIRDNFYTKRKMAAEEAMRELLFSSELYQNTQIFFLYASFRSEADTWMLLDRMLLDQKEVYMPRTQPAREGQEGSMEFFRVRAREDLVPGLYGIYEPGSHCPAFGENPKGAVCLLPGLVFDRRGGRIGYGGGYYDRYLKGHPGIVRVGMGFSFQCIPEIPMETFDIKLQYLLTEKEMVSWN